MAAALGMNQRKLLYFLLPLVAALMTTAEVDVVLAARTLSPLTTEQRPVVTSAQIAGRSSSEGEARGGEINRPATRRMAIGSRAPTCTYNECRGCRHRCSVQEVPVDAGDPMNSAYHYRCICHF